MFLVRKINIHKKKLRLMCVWILDENENWCEKGLSTFSHRISASSLCSGFPIIVLWRLI